MTLMELIFLLLLAFITGKQLPGYTEIKCIAFTRN